MPRPRPNPPPSELEEAIGEVIVGYKNRYHSYHAIYEETDAIRVRDILPAHAIKKLAEDIPAYLRQKWMPLS